MKREILSGVSHIGGIKSCMIIDFIFTFIGSIISWVFSVLPDFTFINTIIEYERMFFEWLNGFIPYSLWFFDIQVLKISFTVIFVYFSFLIGEYFYKLIVKYVTRLF